jgi:hypothetical protein
MKTYTLEEIRKKHKDFKNIDYRYSWQGSEHISSFAQFCGYLEDLEAEEEEDKMLHRGDDEEFDAQEPEQPSTALPECSYAGPCDYKCGTADTNDQDYGC